MKSAGADAWSGMRILSDVGDRGSVLAGSELRLARRHTGRIQSRRPPSMRPMTKNHTRHDVKS